MTDGFLIEKLSPLKFDMNALNLIFDNLTRRKQKVKIYSTLTYIWTFFKASRKNQV